MIQIVLSRLFSSHHFTTAGNEIGKSLINKTCSHTEFPDVCISTLESDPRSSSANLTDLPRIALELTLPKANETLVKAYNLLKNASTHNQFVRSLCFTSLNVTLVDLKESPIL